MSRKAGDRVLVIGLDMGDVELIEKWSAEGFLPTFRSLMGEGAWGTLDTTADALHTSSWPTIFTGTLPGKHGVYYPYQPQPGRQQPTHIGAGQYGAPPVWQILDRAGKRSIVFDAPETFPVPGFTGVQVFEWGTWAWYWKRMTTPLSIGTELTLRFGPYPLTVEAKRLGFGVPDLVALRRQLVAGAQQKGNITRWLMHSRPWDLFLVVFGELHAAGHYFWPEHAPVYRRNGGAAGDVAASELRDVYTAVDAAVGEIISACDGDVTVLVVSGDGVGPNHCGWHLLPQVLARSGFTSAQSAAPSGNGRTSDNGRAGGSVVDRLRQAVPPRLRSQVTSRLPWKLRHWLAFQLAYRSVDWSRTRAFTLPADLEGCVRINRRDREPHGIVEPGSHYDDVCAELAELFMSLINPATGRPAVRRVCRIDQLFPGERRHHLPDLTVIWNDEAELSAVHSDRLGVVSEASGDPRTGTHYPLSFVAARGPRSRMQKIRRGHIADLAATLLAHFGVNVTSGMDGRPLEIFQ
jgi:predicted AlkP superfamily phosphohydrolase/phosphomutase